MSAKTIAVVNHKGGSGKTTTAVSLASYLAMNGHKTLLVDMDAQANASEYCYLLMEENTIYNVMVGEKSIREVIQKVPDLDDDVLLDMVPSDIELGEIELTIGGKFSREFILKNALAEVKDEYDFIIIDCPPSITLQTINSLAAADFYITITQPTTFSIRGAEKVSVIIANVLKQINPNLKHLGALITFFDSRLTLHKQMEETIKEIFGDEVFKTKIRQNVALTESAASSVNIFTYAPKSYGAEDYSKFAKEVLRKIKKG